MDADVRSGPSNLRAVADFFDSASLGAKGLIVEGDPGIGKTTLWVKAIEQAHSRGFQVLSARAAAAESVMAYAALADLLDSVDTAIWANLPQPQRNALDQVLLRADADGVATNRRAVAAAFLSVLKRLADTSPVLVAVDDLHWLDPSSKQALAFAARRLPVRTGIIGTVRTDPHGIAANWLELTQPDGINRFSVSPLTLAGLHTIVAERLGRALPRPTMARIHEVSGGNPFYALELARTMHTAALSAEPTLPGSLADLVRSRIDGLGSDIHEILLAATCLANPRVNLIALATDSDAEHILARAEVAEAQGIIWIDRQTLRFTHPLLAAGIYSNTAPARRRAMHRRLAAIVEEPELQARHLALAATTGDPLTLQSLDRASEIARVRGAPAAAAELLDLAVGLGGDTPQRRTLSANHHLDAGDAGRARVMLDAIIAELAPGVGRAKALNLLAVVRLSDDSFSEAAAILEQALPEAGEDRLLSSQTLVMLAFALLNSGDLAVAVRRATEAAEQAEGLDQPHLLSQALSMRTLLSFMHGAGLDGPALNRAVSLEDHEANTPVPFRPSMHHAMLLTWTGQLEHAQEQMTVVWRRCVEHGGENELMYIAMHRFLLQLWRADFTEAALVAEDARERAAQLAGDVAVSVALTISGALAVFTGQVDDARRDIAEAFEAVLRGGSYRLAGWLLTTLGFLEVTLGNHQAALDTFEPLLARLAAAPNGTEIIVASFVPDAVEAMIAMDRADDAAKLIDLLERNGRRLDRPWMLATGARCRAMWFAAGGELDAARLTAEQAMAEHARLPMPFERARTQLFLGQIERRQRFRQAASTTLNEALTTFEELGTPMWADRARAELSRCGVGSRQEAELTASEQRVAELAALGMNTRELAAALFISPKTVEAHLTRIYRKLGVRSRTQLGLRMSGPAT